MIDYEDTVQPEQDVCIRCAVMTDEDQVDTALAADGLWVCDECAETWRESWS